MWYCSFFFCYKHSANRVNIKRFRIFNYVRPTSNLRHYFDNARRNRICPFVLVGWIRYHRCRTHNNRLPLPLTMFCNWCIYKNTGMHPQALFLLFGNCNQGKLLLTALLVFFPQLLLIANKFILFTVYLNCPLTEKNPQGLDVKDYKQAVCHIHYNSISASINSFATFGPVIERTTLLSESSTESWKVKKVQQALSVLIKLTKSSSILSEPMNVY